MDVFLLKKKQWITGQVLVKIKIFHKQFLKLIYVLLELTKNALANKYLKYKKLFYYFCRIQNS